MNKRNAFGTIVLISAIFVSLLAGVAFGYLYFKKTASPSPVIDNKTSPPIVKMSDEEAKQFFGAETILENNLPDSIKFTFKNTLCPNQDAYNGNTSYKIPDGYYLWYCGSDYKKYDSYTYVMELKGKTDPWVKEENPILNLAQVQVRPTFLGNISKTSGILFDFMYAKSADPYGFNRYEVKNQIGEKFLFLSNAISQKYSYSPIDTNSIFDPTGSHNYGGTGLKVVDKNSKFKISYIGIKTNNKEMFKNLNTEVVFSARDSFGQQFGGFGKIENKSNPVADMLKNLFGAEEVQACGPGNLTQDVGKSSLVLERIEDDINWYRLTSPINLYNFQQGVCYDKDGKILNTEGCQYCSDCDNNCNEYSIHDQRHFECLDSCAYYCSKWSDKFYENNGLRFNIFYEPNDKIGFLKMQVANVILSDEMGRYFEPAVTASSFSNIYRAYLDDPTCFTSEVELPENCP